MPSDPLKIFISYTQADREWAEWIAWQLDEAGHEPTLQAWHFGPGSDFVHKMHTAIRESDRTIAVLSPAYERSAFSQTEWAGAFADDPTGEDRKLVPVRVEPYEPTGLLRTKVYVDLVDLAEDDARERLLDGLRGPGKPSQAPPYPGKGPRAASAKPRFPGAKRAVLWNVPYPRNPYFTGRETILKELRERLTQSGSAALGQTEAIIGLGGIGKTQTAVEYAYRHRDDYQAIFFVRAETEAEILSGYREIARLLGYVDQEQEQSVGIVLDWLSDRPGWLLILDNADEPELVKPYLPTIHQGHVLLTSRARVFDMVGIVQPFEMETLPPDDAARLLLKRAARDDERACATHLAEELGYLPLALEQAGAYILAKQARFQDYLTSYRRRGLELLEKGQPQGHREPVATTWFLNFQAVKETSLASAELLSASAFLSPDDIPLDILTKGAKELGPVLAEALADDDPLAMDEILEPLTRYSLIQRNLRNRTYNIHRLVQEVLKRDMAVDDRRVWAERVVGALNRTIPHSMKDTPISGPLLLQAVAARQFIDRYALKSQEAARLVSYFEWLKLYSDASLLKATCLMRIFHEYFEKRDPPLLMSMNLDLILEKRDAIVARNFNNLHRDHYEGIESLYRDALKFLEKTLREDHTVVATTLNNLGLFYYYEGRYEEAEVQYQRALAIKEKALGQDHPELAKTLNNLALLYTAQGRLSDAEPLYQRALEIKEKALGQNHHSVAITLRNYADLLRKTGRDDEANELDARAEKIESIKR